MAYLDNTEITVDAILTKKGRQKLASGQSLNISKFALGDDEIDYTLYEPAHPKGSAYYDSAIRAIPVTEASPDETQILRYKLVTLPKKTARIPVISVSQTSATLTSPGQVFSIVPTTTNFTSGNATLGYSAILSDSSVCDIIVTKALQNNIMPTTARFIGDNEDAQSVAVSGFEFKVTAKTQMVEDKTATVTIIANETGGTVTMRITVKKATTATI